MRCTAVIPALLAAFAVAAAELKDLPYYEAGAPQTGNREYLQKRCKLDLYLPDGQKGFPTLVWFHGGGLNAGNKHCPKGLRRDKIAVAAVNYRLSGKGAECPDYLFDAAAAAAWVKKHIAEYGGDPEKVYISGHSAGGYLTTMLAMDAKYLKTFNCGPHDFAAYLPISGPMTTPFRIRHERRIKGETVPDTVLDEYAPVQLAGKNVPPIILLVGDPALDIPARAEENRLLAARLKRIYRNSNVACHSFPGFDHTSVLHPGIAVINAVIRKGISAK